MEILIFVAIIFAIIGANMARNRGRSTGIWAVVCALTGLIGVLILAVAGDARK